MEMIEAKNIAELGLKLQKKMPNVIGWSNKVRNNRIRVYIKEASANASQVEAAKINGVEHQIEYVVIGEVKVL